MSVFWIWGRRPVLEALRAGNARQILLAADRRAAPILNEIRTAAGKGGVPVREVEPGEIERIAPDESAQGVAAEVEVRVAGDVADLLLPTKSAPFLVACDQIQDPHNLGALLRTAHAAGVTGVVMPDRHTAPLSGAVAKTSAGALSHVRVARVPNLARAINDMQGAGIWVMGLDGDAITTVYDADLTVPLALVVGGEGGGLRRLTRDRCDLLLRLPMAGAVGSLNASVAGGIAMFEVVRQRL